MRRGFVFTLDALLALALVTVMVAGIVGVTSSIPNVYTTHIQGENKQVAESLLETFRTVPLSNLVPPTQIENWITGTDPVLNLTYVNPQMSPLRIVATYWALNSTVYRQKAETIMRYLLENLAGGYKYQLIINNYTSPYLTFDNSYRNAIDVGTATAFISGYVSNETPRGYVAKAYLTKMITAQEKLVGIQRVLAGGEYCSNLVPSLSYNTYNLTVSSLYLEYQTVPGDKNTVQSGNFRLSGSYSGGNVDIDENLDGWNVEYNLNWRDYVTSITLSKNRKSLVLYTSYESGSNPKTYSVYGIKYTDENGNIAVISLTDGVYVEVSGWGWSISSSKAYTTAPPSIDYAVYGTPVTSYECSDTSDNSLDINFRVILPNDANVTEGTWNAAQRGGYESMDVYINGHQLGNPYSSDVTDLFGSGINIVETNFSSYGDDEIGFGSGSWISLKYKTSTPQVDDPGLVKLYSVKSNGTGIYYLNSIFVPGNVTGISIKLTVKGVHEVRVYYSNGTALNLIYENTSIPTGLTTVTIDNKTLMKGQPSLGVKGLLDYTTLRDLSKKNFNLVIMLDAYYDSNYDRPVRYAGQDYNYNWDNKRSLYGYPDSYINITYTPKVELTRFMIPLERTYPLNGENQVWQGAYRTMYFYYYLPEKAIPWYVDSWTAIQFSGYTSGTLTLYEGSNANTEVFSIPLDYYLIRVAYTRLNDNIMVPGDVNEFKLESDSNDYGFRVKDSRAIVHYFLKGYAAYGKTFTYYSQDNACGYNLTYWYNLSGEVNNGTILIGNCPPSESPKILSTYNLTPWKYALDDAIYRLFVQLGAREYSVDQMKADNKLIPGTKENPIRIELKGLAGKAIGIKSVPNSEGGIQVTLRVWRGS